MMINCVFGVDFLVEFGELSTDPDRQRSAAQAGGGHEQLPAIDAAPFEQEQSGKTARRHHHIRRRELQR